MLNKEESKSGIEGVRIKNTESESFGGWCWSVFMLYVERVKGKGLVYGKSSTCDRPYGNCTGKCCDEYECKNYFQDCDLFHFRISMLIVRNSLNLMMKSILHPRNLTSV